ncbi:PaaI family thioesterase, partial [Streptomyces sp. NPDC006129]|uniref:PaaI family thioesterase n=1 Tax=Streptomyces sp. NPDC006129 TaxID=3155348 RepID=UPI0033AA11BB
MSDAPALEALLRAVPFAGELGIALEEAAPARVEAALAWTPELCTVGGVLHGGALMALADTAGAVCAFLNLPPGASTSTVESKTNFFRAVRSSSGRPGNCWCASPWTCCRRRSWPRRRGAGRRP